MDLISMKRLQSAADDVQEELISHGAWDQALSSIDIFLVPVGSAYGWQFYGTTGEICVPTLSLAKFSDWYHGNFTSLRDVLRHEYAHALADTHRGLMRGAAFRDAFDAPHSSSVEWEFDDEVFVSEYAATAPSEDFAETFMFYLRHNGRLPERLNTPWIKKRWRFIRQICDAVQRGCKRM